MFARHDAFREGRIRNLTAWSISAHLFPFVSQSGTDFVQFTAAKWSFSLSFGMAPLLLMLFK
jgi:hypothetical protein